MNFLLFMLVEWLYEMPEDIAAREECIFNSLMEHRRNSLLNVASVALHIESIVHFFSPNMDQTIVKRIFLLICVRKAFDLFGHFLVQFYSSNKS